MNKAILKSQIRDSIRERRSLLSEEQIKEAAEVLASNVADFKDKEFVELLKSAKCVALYKAVRGELSCDGVTKYLESLGKTVCFPRVKGDTMDFYEVNDSEKDFSEGAYGVPEPKPSCKLVKPEDIDLIFVPAVAYTEEGVRLGQGGGYYDRYLNAYQYEKKPVTIGICYDFQIYSALPVESHDRDVDFLLCVSVDNDI